MKRVALIFGGKSPEHEVSIVSGRNLYKLLVNAGHHVLLAGIDRQGCWHFGEDSFDALCSKAPIDGLSLPQAMETLSRASLDVVFPMVHGLQGEDGCLQGLLQLMELPYVGGDLLNQSLCWDKIATRMVLKEHGLPQPTFIAITQDGFDLDALKVFIDEQLTFPIFVKPARTGSSIGISKVTKMEDVSAAIEQAFLYDHRVIVEQGLVGREVEVAGLGAFDPVISDPAEVLPPEGSYYSFEEKYINDSTRIQYPIELPEGALVKLKNAAKEVWRVLHCHGLARLDFFWVDGVPYLNEVNTIPGFTQISMYPKLMTAFGLSENEMIDRLLDLAIEKDLWVKKKTSSFYSKSSWYEEPSHD